MKKVDRNVAEIAMDKWLAHKRITPRKQENNEDSVETMIDAFEDGILTLNEETKEITHHLLFPLGTNEAVKELKFTARITVGKVKQYLGSVKSGDADGRVSAYIQALTSKSKGEIQGMDTEDHRIAQAITIFFF